MLFLLNYKKSIAEKNHIISHINIYTHTTLRARAQEGGRERDTLIYKGIKRYVQYNKWHKHF